MKRPFFQLQIYGAEEVPLREGANGRAEEVRLPAALVPAAKLRHSLTALISALCVSDYESALAALLSRPTWPSRNPKLTARDEKGEANCRVGCSSQLASRSHMNVAGENARGNERY